MNVPMESGPNDPTAFMHPEMLLAAAGYPIARALPYQLTEALSTGRAIAGIAGTAMGQLAALSNGQPLQLVVFDLTAGARR